MSGKLTVKMSKVSTNVFGPEIAMAAQRQYSQVQACFDLIASIESIEDERPKIDLSLSEHLTKDQKSEFNDLLREAAEVLLNATKPKGSGSMTISGEGRDPEAYAAFSQVFIGAGMNVSFPKRSEMIQKSVLILLIVGFETLLTDLSTIAIRRNPGVANLDSHTLSLAELQGLGSVEDATDFLVSRYVEDLARGSLEGWVKWFAKVGVKLDEIPVDWVQFREVFARRNLLVHTDGKVSNQYIGTLVDAGANRSALPSKDEVIVVTPSYLRSSSELLMSAGALLSTSLWMKLTPDSPDKAIQWSISTAERALEDGHFDASIQICRKIASVCKNRLDLVTDCKLKTVEWTARAMLGGEDEVATKAAEWDVRGVDVLYSHVRSVLMKDDETAFRQIVALVDAQRLSRLTILKSPVYHGLRARMGLRIRTGLGIQPSTKLPTDEQVASIAALEAGQEIERTTAYDGEAG